MWGREREREREREIIYSYYYMKRKTLKKRSMYHIFTKINIMVNKENKIVNFYLNYTNKNVATIKIIIIRKKGNQI